MDESVYDTLAELELSAIVEALDALSSDAFQAELESGILTIEFQDGTRYVVNSHRAARQIWMAAERSAWHFDWDPSAEHWHAKKTNEELWPALERVLGAKLGEAVVLRRAT